MQVSLLRGEFMFELVGACDKMNLWEINWKLQGV